MSAYVVITGDDKQGVVYPDIYGPFATDAEAQAFAERAVADEQYKIEVKGGYFGVHVVSDATAKDPSGWKPIDDDGEDWVDIQARERAASG